MVHRWGMNYVTERCPYLVYKSYRRSRTYPTGHVSLSSSVRIAAGSDAVAAGKVRPLDVPVTVAEVFPSSLSSGKSGPSTHVDRPAGKHPPSILTRLRTIKGVAGNVFGTCVGQFQSTNIKVTSIGNLVTFLDLSIERCSNRIDAGIVLIGTWSR